MVDCVDPVNPRIETALEVGARRDGVQSNSFHNSRKFVGKAPTLWIHLRSRNKLTLQSPGIHPAIEGDDVNTKLR